MSAFEVQIIRLPHGAGLPLPQYQSAQAAGLDLVAAVPEDAPVVIEPGRSAMIPTGIALALPTGFEGQVRPRSGLAAKHAVTVLNSPGTIGISIGLFDTSTFTFWASGKTSSAT